MAAANVFNSSAASRKGNGVPARRDSCRLPAVHELEREKRLSLVATNLVDLQDIWMAQPRDSFCLSLESRHPTRIRAQVAPDHFESDNAFEPQLVEHDIQPPYRRGLSPPKARTRQRIIVFGRDSPSPHSSFFGLLVVGAGVAPDPASVSNGKSVPLDGSIESQGRYSSRLGFSPAF